MVHLKIDGRPVEAPDGATVLEAAKAAGIPIPTLCFHDALEAYGGCRLCMVEIGHPNWRGWKGLVTSCLYPVEDGLEVDTGNERVRESRKTVLDLLLARCPDSPEVREMAAEYGVLKSSFPDSGLDTTCVLCTLCVRVCEKIGASAIGTAGRGQPKRIAPPFDLPAEQCIGCFSCVRICPTDAIEYEETPTTRKIWGREFEVVACEGCGQPLMTVEERAHEAERSGLPEDFFTKCPACKKRETAETIGRTFAPLQGGVR